MRRKRSNSSRQELSFRGRSDETVLGCPLSSSLSEMQTASTVVGLGEVLWDLLPSGRQLGGAPANFAHSSHLLGDRAMVASRIGADELGQEIRRRLLSRGMSDEFLQADSTHPTGTVSVELDAEGRPAFAIRYPAAWDFLEWNEGWRALAQSADAVSFGSLAQRSAVARATILSFLDQTRPEALRIFDVNFRQSSYSRAIVTDSIRRARIVKLNHEELPRMAELLAIPVSDDRRFATALIERFGVNLVCITRGAQGSLLASSTHFDEHPGFRVEVKDTVGSGDAFTAGLVHEYLRAGSLERMNQTANQMGAWVAFCSGAMPLPPEAGLRKTLEQLQVG